MKHRTLVVLFVVLPLLCAGCLLAKQAPAFATESTKVEKKKPEPQITSPEVGADGKVTFRVFAPAAKAVTVSGDYGNQPAALKKDAEGVWAATVPLPSGLWAYSFTIDGQRQLDPANAWVKPSRVPTTSVVLVPATPRAAFEHQGVREGTVHLHSYFPKALGHQRRLRVYTPAGYEKGNVRYPVLYLLHGFSDNEAAWSEFGCAHIVADNLIAAKKTVPMIIVMTDGHAIPMNRDRWSENLQSFRDDMLTEVVPFIDARYRTKATPNDRAVVGLSMGGEQALALGINHPDVFAWVGGMSAATRQLDVFARALQKPNVLNKKLRLLWIAIGKDDFLLQDNHKFIEELKGKSVKHEYSETEGGHTWPVWRSYLVEILPRLFQKAVKIKA